MKYELFEFLVENLDYYEKWLKQLKINPEYFRIHGKSKQQL